MGTLRRRIVQFFFPPPGSPRIVRALPYAVLGALTLLVGVVGVTGWEYTNSPEFCGTACHTMPPEFTSYLISPHARIECVECHIGRGFVATRFTRKAGDVSHIVKLAFKQYEFPIRAKELRPARETCERCHSPEKFSDDSLRTLERFGDDPANTPVTIYLTMKTGGGSKRLGLGRGIHWHVENPVLFYAPDSHAQEIPFVRVISDDGSATDFMELGAELDPESFQAEDLRPMDCITCHNRITHMILPPPDSVDQLMSRGLISASIPEIHRRAVQTLSGSLAFDRSDMALNSIAGLENYYQQAYPEFYAANQSLITGAIQALQQAYRQSVFLEQKADWNSHPNNIGHQDSPGCFRCHDGKHLNNAGEAIRLECNLCHSIPVEAGPEDLVATIEISRGPEPESHLHTNWIGMHRDVFDPTCANCHSTNDPGGTSNTSFCSNTACHGMAYPYAGFDAPGLREILLQQLPPTPEPVAWGTGALTYEESIGPLLAARCGACHGETAIQGLNLTTYAGALRGGEGGPALVPGDPEASLLLQIQSAETPHFGRLTAEELALVTEWIAAGAPEQ